MAISVIGLATMSARCECRSRDLFMEVTPESSALVATSYVKKPAVSSVITMRSTIMRMSLIGMHSLTSTLATDILTYTLAHIKKMSNKIHLFDIPSPGPLFLDEKTGNTQ